jgi:ABC-type oligopeptide transport system substrate-binding subunit
MAPANASAALTTAIAAAKPTSIADLEDGKDAYWNPQLGKLFFEAAKAELGSSVTWPVYIDFGYRHDSDTVQSYHEEIERVYNGIEAGGQKTAISPYKAEEYGINKDYVDMHSVGYKDNDYQDARRAGFWSLYIMSWGPDYADPKTYLDTWSTQGAWVPYLDLEEPGKSDLKKSILGPIDDDIKPSTDLLTDYYAATTDAARDAIAKARFQKMAEAEFNQIFKYGISLPAGCFRGNIGEVSRVTRIEPYTDGRSNIGLGNLRIKDRRLSKTPYTREQFKTIEDAWKVAKANAQGIV